MQTWHIDDPKVPHDADAFASGATAMLFRESWVIGEIQSKNPKLQYGVAPIPAWKAGMPRMMLLQPWGVYVNGQSQNKAAAWDFVKFLTNAAERAAADRDDRMAVAAQGHRLEAADRKDPAVRSLRVAAARREILCRTGPDGVR